MRLPNKQQLHYFLFSQYLADGFRVTLEIILPVIIFAQFGKMNTGLTFSLGALAVSICDIPGPLVSRRNGMLYCIGFVFVMSLITGVFNQNIFLLGLLIALASFFFTMISVYGNRAASVGTAALLVMVLRIPDIAPMRLIVTDSLFILAGATWYFLMALLFYRLKPYRPAQRALGDCIHETAKFLRIKAGLYDIKINFEEEYGRLVKQQITVNEKQDTVRELLFKNKEILKEPSQTGRLLILSFVNLVDLYEQITATWYDYGSLRERFGQTGILDDVSLIIQQLSDELDHIGMAIQANRAYEKKNQLIPALEALKKKVDLLEDINHSNLVLKKIIVNLRRLGEHIDEMVKYFSLAIPKQNRLRDNSDYTRFVSHQEIDFVIFKNNLVLKSGIFRHALRMMITCIAGFIIAKLIAYGHHSYWILLTIIILLKPGYSLTRERNIQRFAGTIAGGLVGLLILYFIHDRNVLFGIIVFLMLGTYTFMRLNYIATVVFTTPYVLILFSLLGMGFLQVAEERLLDTGIACLLSFSASYLLFPQWEALQLQTYIKNVLKANISYLDKLATLFSGRPIPQLEYKLARKDLYVSLANLSAAFNRMLSEPKHKQRNGNIIYEFVVLNHVLSANIASIAAEISPGERQRFPAALTRQVRRSIASLRESLREFEKDAVPAMTEDSTQPWVKEISTDEQLAEQVDFIYKLTLDINRVMKSINQ